MRFPLLKRVTLTGGDDSVQPQQLLTLAEQYAQAEFAVLFAPNRHGPRYPSPYWGTQMATAFENRRNQLALHLCGGYSQSILIGDVPNLPDPAKGLLYLAGRIQINFTGREPIDETKLAVVVKRFKDETGTQCIFQLKHSTEAMLTRLSEHVEFDVLFDASGGKGVTPAYWPALPSFRYREVGYAGGLNPDMLPTQLEAIAAQSGTTPINIDFETSIREPGVPNQYSLARSAEVLKIAAQVAT